MQIQPIQTNQTTNNCRKPNFKMRMLNDPRGHYIRLWSNETKDEYFKNTLKQFLDKQKNHVLEIINVYESREANNLHRLGTNYDVINHTTGKSGTIFVFMKPQLSNLFKGIMKNEELFETDELTDLYKQSVVQMERENTISSV